MYIVTLMNLKTKKFLSLYLPERNFCIRIFPLYFYTTKGISVTVESV